MPGWNPSPSSCPSVSYQAAAPAARRMAVELEAPRPCDSETCSRRCTWPRPEGASSLTCRGERSIEGLIERSEGPRTKQHHAGGWYAETPICPYGVHVDGVCKHVPALDTSAHPYLDPTHSTHREGLKEDLRGISAMRGAPREVAHGEFGGGRLTSKHFREQKTPILDLREPRV